MREPTMKIETKGDLITQAIGETVLWILIFRLPVLLIPLMVAVIGYMLIRRACKD